MRLPHYIRNDKIVRLCSRRSAHDTQFAMAACPQMASNIDNLAFKKLL